MAMRTVAVDHNAARLMGVNVDTTISITFAIGSAFAALGGVLYAIAYPQIHPFMGIMPGLKAFTAAVLGGIGIIPGAVLGALIMGQVETLTSAYISSQMRDAIAFAILILVLLFRPTGLLGRTETEKV
jgi:branched-chain amino acid transport system permease protein